MDCEGHFISFSGLYCVSHFSVSLNIAQNCFIVVVPRVLNHFCIMCTKYCVLKHEFIVLFLLKIICSYDQKTDQINL